MRDNTTEPQAKPASTVAVRTIDAQVSSLAVLLMAATATNVPTVGTAMVPLTYGSS